jgi:Domain of unknown function (DUF6456)
VVKGRDKLSKSGRDAEMETHDPRIGYGGRPPVLAVVQGIAGTDAKAREVVRRNTNHCTLCRLHHLGHLRDRAGDDSKLASIRHAAGEKLQDDHSLAGLSAIPGTLSFGPRGGGFGPTDISQIKIDAAGRKKKALSAVGRSARFLLEHIVIEDMTLTQTAQLMSVKDNAVLPALRVALDALAAHYGLAYSVRAKIRGGAAQPIHPFQEFE